VEPRSSPRFSENPTNNARNNTTRPSISSGNSYDDDHDHDSDSDNISVKSEPNVPDLSYFLAMGFLDVHPGGTECNAADDMV